MSFEEIVVNSSSKQQFIDVTSKINEIVGRSKVENGICLLYVPHTTAGITINENADPDVVKDVLNVLNRLIPVEGDYNHLEGNAHAHVKASIVGNHVALIIDGGELVLGTWQGVFFCEFDGPRRRRIMVKILRE